MKKLTCVVLVALVGTLVCASVPQWVDNPSSYSRDSTLLVAVGEGSTRFAAEQAAATNLASIFGVSVSSTSSTTSLDVMASGGGRDFASSLQGYSMQSEHSVKMDDLVGMKIRETYKDGGSYYALAVLDKGIAIPYYSREAETLSGKAQEIYENLARQTDELESVRSAKALYQVLVDLETVRQILVVINPTGVRITQELPSLRTVEALINELLEDVVFSVTITGDSNNYIDNVFKSLLSDRSVRITSQGSRYVIEGKLNGSTTTLPGNPFIFYKYTFAASVKDMKTRKTVLSFQTSGREGHASIDNARSRALSKLEEQIQDEFGAMFDEKFL